MSAGGEGAITKKLSIDNEEELVEVERQLDLEVKQYEMLLKRAKLESMKKELGTLLLEISIFS